MKIEVIGTGPVLHGIATTRRTEEGEIIHGSDTLKIPPGIYLTSDEDKNSMVSLELAQYLIKTTNGHVREYVPPPPQAIEVVTIEAATSEKQKLQEELARAQAAQTARFEQAKVDRERENSGKRK